MTRNRWHMHREEGVLTYSRRIPARFDVMAETVFPALRKGRLAVLIRQDLWRELQDLRGFSPVIEVRTQEGGLVVRAGGSVDGPFSQRAIAGQIETLLADPAKRARWIGHSQLRPRAA